MALLATVVSALIQAFALTNFFQAGGLLSGGVSGIALMLDKYTNGVLSLSLMLIVINIPLALLAYFNVGKNFTIFSTINVFLTSFFIQIMPVFNFSGDILINSLCAGIFSGLSVGIALEAGLSGGGTDFVALFISTKKQVSAGKYMLILNGAIVLVGGIIFDPTVAAYTLIATYAMGKVVDSIHLRYQRVTLAIITTHGKEVNEYLTRESFHGVTIMDAVGGYSNQERKFIYIVVSTYQVKELKDGIFDIDANAFINVTKSVNIYGNFVSPKYS